MMSSNIVKALHCIIIKLSNVQYEVLHNTLTLTFFLTLSFNHLYIRHTEIALFKIRALYFKLTLFPFNFCVVQRRRKLWTSNLWVGLHSGGLLSHELTFMLFLLHFFGVGVRDFTLHCCVDIEPHTPTQKKIVWYNLKNTCSLSTSHNRQATATAAGVGVFKFKATLKLMTKILFFCVKTALPQVATFPQPIWSENIAEILVRRLLINFIEDWFGWIGYWIKT